jgi:hypothetical protein
MLCLVMVKVVTCMDIFEAVKLLGVVSDFSFKDAGEVPRFSIFDGEKEGFVVCVKANLVGEEYYEYLKRIIRLRNLRMRKSKGYLMIHS